MWHFGGADGGKAPQFSIEPASLVEYTNSSGALISCRPQQVAASMEQQFAQANSAKTSNANNEQQRRSPSNMGTTVLAGAPTSITWHLCNQLGCPHDGQQVHSSGLFGGQQQLADESSNNNSGEVPSSSAASKQSGESSKLKRPLVRQDGSLVLSQFQAAQYKPEIHSATYRCCLANQFGALCSRPVRTKAGK